MPSPPKPRLKRDKIREAVAAAAAGLAVGLMRDLELRAAILGYGPTSGDDSGRVVVQPRAIATRTRSL